MKKNIIIGLTAIMLILTIVPGVISQPMRGMRGERGFYKHDGMFRDLQLTEDQTSKMRDLRLAHQKEVLPKRTEIRTKMAELKLMQTEENPNMKRIDSKIDEISKLRGELQKTRVRHQQKIRELLTPEQKKIFDSKKLQGRGMKGRGGKFHQKGGRCF